MLRRWATLVVVLALAGPEQASCFVAVLADPVVAGDFVVGHLTAELEIDDPPSPTVAAALSGCAVQS